MIETEQEQIIVFGTDANVRIPVQRNGPGVRFPATCTWEAEDDTALRGKHYRAWKGIIEFEEGENKLV